MSPKRSQRIHLNAITNPHHDAELHPTLPLPPELRLKVFDYVFDSPCLIIDPTANQALRQRRSRAHTSVLLVSRLVYHEAIAVLSTRKVFHFTRCDELIAWLNMRQGGMEAVRSVGLSIKFKDVIYAYALEGRKEGYELALAHLAQVAPNLEQLALRFTEVRRGQDWEIVVGWWSQVRERNNTISPILSLRSEVKKVAERIVSSGIQGLKELWLHGISDKDTLEEMKTALQPMLHKGKAPRIW